MSHFTNNQISRCGKETVEDTLARLVPSESSWTDSKRVKKELLESMLDILAERQILQIQPPTGENIVSQELFDIYYILDSGRWRNSLYAVDALVYERIDDNLVLNLFILDDFQVENFKEASILSVDEAKRKFEHLAKFLKLSGDGTLVNKNDINPELKKAAESIFINTDRISSVKLFLLSPRVFDSRLNYQIEKFKWNDTGISKVSCAKICYDLIQMISAIGGPGSVSQELFSYGGIPALKVSGDQEKYDCYLSYLPGDVLAQLYGVHGTASVQANVRAYLGESRKVNKGIAETIINNPEDFLAFNNGLVIFAENALFDEGKLFSIDNLQIINGGQTSATVYITYLKAQNSKGRNASNKEVIESKIRRLKVPLKLIVPNKNLLPYEIDDMQVGVCVAANSQNAIKASDISSRTKFNTEFKHISMELPSPQDGSFWFYESLRGEHQNELNNRKGRRKELNEFLKLYPKNQVLRKADIAIPYVAFEKKANLAAKGAEICVGEINNAYSAIDQLSEDEVKELLAKAIIFKELTSIMEDRKKEHGITNPRVPILYAIQVLMTHVPEVINFGEIWNLQRLPYDKHLFLYRLILKVNEVIRNNMGQRMISQYGKSRECFEAVDREIGRNSVYQLMTQN